MTGQFAEVALSAGAREIDRLYSYRIPDHLPKVTLGSKVLVPFGQGNRLAEGFVLSLASECAYPRVKSIVHHVDGPVQLSDKQVDLVNWIRKTYLCTYAEAITAVIPAGTGLKKKVMLRSLSLSDALQEETGISREWTALADVTVSDGKLRKWVKGQVVEQVEQFTTAAKEQLDPIISLMGDPGTILDQIPSRYTAQRSTIQYLAASKTGLRQSKLTGKKGVTTAVLRRLETLGHIEIVSARKERRPDLYRKDQTQDIVLNEDQTQVYQSVKTSIDAQKFHTWLLHGVTGSGKTEVYLNLVEDVLAKGKTSIVLVPEISLTPQIVNKFINRFGDQVAVFHSKLSLGERYDQWVAVKEGRLPIVIGARSALFAPIENVGLIIMDEEHDGSYKSDMNPKYHTVEVATFIGRQHGAPLLLGSATPSIESYEKQRSLEYGYLQLQSRYAGQQLPGVDIVDMREELEAGNRSVFSEALREAIEDRLRKKEQIILFLNRKGHSTFVSCRSCGFSLKCPHCDISLTFHKGAQHVSCSYCGYQIQVPKTCPSCSSRYFKFFGTGTEKLEELTAAAFPGARVGRMDRVSTSKKGALESLIDRFDRHELDILVGTQMVTKGLDFHNVTLVGVLSADVLLNLPDFQASERAFQLLTQVAGRAGRGSRKGEVIIQTYAPEHYSVLAASGHDYHAFVESELGVRQIYGYPPYGNIANILISGSNEGEVTQMASNLIGPIQQGFIKKGLKNVEVLGPNPAIYSKMKGRHRWQILVKYPEKDREAIGEILRQICLIDSRQKRQGDVYVSVDIKAKNIL